MEYCRINVNERCCSVFSLSGVDNHLGSEEYGNILYLISIMNIIAISVGRACNYARMTESATKDTWNINYNIILMASSVIVIPVMLIIVSSAAFR